MIVLGIDPGMSCGYALRDGERIFASGVWNLRGTRHEGAGMRWLHLRGFLHRMSLDVAARIEMVAYEEVRHHAGTDAAHIYGGVVATLQAFCEERRTPYTAINVSTVKKAATGSGRADKAAMVRAAQARWPAENVTDDNHADALWIAEAALREVNAK